jgi:hypothetical protein
VAVPLVAAGAIGAGLLIGGAAGAIKSGVLGTYNPTHHAVDPNMVANGDARGDAFRSALNDQMTKAGGRTAPSLGNAAQFGGARMMPGAGVANPNINQGPANQGRAFQLGLMNQLQQQANGQGPSQAGMMLNQGMSASLKAQQAAAASARGNMNAALQSRMLGQQAASMQQQTAGQAAQMKVQEQFAAQQALAGLSTGMRGQDLGVAQQQAALGLQAGQFNAGQYNQAQQANAGFAQQAGLANMDARNKFGLADADMKMRMTGMNDQYTAQMMGMYGDTDRAAMENVSQYEKMRMDSYYKFQDTNMAADEAGKARKAKFWGGIMGAGGSMLSSMSDENQKEDIEDVDSGSVKAFYKALSAKTYRYKNPSAPGAGEGRHTSVMAQALERSELGKPAVSEDSEGRKVVDYGKLMGTMLAGQAEMHKDIETLKRALTKGK